MRIWRGGGWDGCGDEWGVVWLCVFGWRLAFFFPLLRRGEWEWEERAVRQSIVSHSNCYWCCAGWEKNKIKMKKNVSQPFEEEVCSRGVRQDNFLPVLRPFSNGSSLFVHPPVLSYGISPNLHSVSHRIFPIPLNSSSLFFPFSLSAPEGREACRTQVKTLLAPYLPTSPSYLPTYSPALPCLTLPTHLLVCPTLPSFLLTTYLPTVPAYYSFYFHSLHPTTSSTFTAHSYPPPPLSSGSVYASPSSHPNDSYKP